MLGFIRNIFILLIAIVCTFFVGLNSAWTAQPTCNSASSPTNCIASSNIVTNAGVIPTESESCSPIGDLSFPTITNPTPQPQQDQPGSLPDVENLVNQASVPTNALNDYYRSLASDNLANNATSYLEDYQTKKTQDSNVYQNTINDFINRSRQEQRQMIQNAKNELYKAKKANEKRSIGDDYHMQRNQIANAEDIFNLLGEKIDNGESLTQSDLTGSSSATSGDDESSSNDDTASNYVPLALDPSKTDELNYANKTSYQGEDGETNSAVFTSNGNYSLSPGAENFVDCATFVGGLLPEKIKGKYTTLDFVTFWQVQAAKRECEKFDFGKEPENCNIITKEIKDRYRYSPDLNLPDGIQQSRNKEVVWSRLNYIIRVSNSFKAIHLHYNGKSNLPQQGDLIIHHTLTSPRGHMMIVQKCSQQKDLHIYCDIIDASQTKGEVSKRRDFITINNKYDNVVFKDNLYVLRLRKEHSLVCNSGGGA